VAACAVGSDQIKLLFEEFGREVTLFYMLAIRQNAEGTTRSFFRKLAAERGTHLQAVDYMDDGSPIALTVTVDAETGGATFDFEGTGESIVGNVNVPKAVANAAITYCVSSSSLAMTTRWPMGKKRTWLTADPVHDRDEYALERRSAG